MVIPILIILILLYITNCFSFRKYVSEGYDNFNQDYDTALNSVVNEEDCENIRKRQYNGQVNAENDKYKVNADFTTDGNNYQNNLTYFDSSDLLPNKDKKVDDNGWQYNFGTNWDESNPQIARVDGNAWLNERKFLGIYSVASSLRNATHDLRRDVPNPQMVVSPWNNTTIMPDTNSKGLNTL